MFFLGFIVGSLVTVLVLMLWGLRSLRNDDKVLNETMKNMELLGSVKYRFKQVEDITNQQLDLIRQAERPSASAAHSRHKNDIAGRIKSLEQDKINIFKTILADGVDPNLSIIMDGEPQLIRMSEAIAMFDGSLSYPDSKTESKIPRTNGLHLVTTSEDSNEQPTSGSDQ